jgi:hypothetical protein
MAALDLRFIRRRSYPMPNIVGLRNIVSPDIGFPVHYARVLASMLCCAFLLVTIPSSALAEPVEVRSGHSGHWYDPVRSGEGWVLEVLEDHRAALYWYTYDGEGRQRWMTALGNVVRDANGEYLDFPSLMVTRGGRFGPDFSPQQVQREHVGSARLRFHDCDRGEFEFDAFDQSLRISVSRLAHVMGTSCESRNGVPWREVGDAAGESGSWYDPARSGEGFTLHWMDPGTPLVTWYSYDGEGRQYWMTGVGHKDEHGQLQFPELQATRGARFGNAFAAEDVERFAWGRLSLDLQCSGARVEYASMLPGFGEGSLRVQHLTTPVRFGCPYRRPKLTDLYDIDFTLLPMADQARGYMLRGITDSGVVVLVPGGSGNRVRRYHTVEDRWEDLVSPYPALGASITDARIFPANDTLLAGQHTWTGASGWQPIEMPQHYRQWFAVDSSPDMRVMVGRGITSSGGSPAADELETWIWDAGAGFSTLPRLERDAGFPTCVSAEGRVVGGYAWPAATTVPPRRTGIAWIDRAEPELIRDRSGVELSIVTACSPDGVIFGADQTVVAPTHPHARQAWWWKSPEQNGYLGGAENVLLSDYFAYQVMQVTGEGSLVLGFYLTRTPGLASDGFLWTPITGMTSVSALFEELGISHPWAGRAGLSLYARAANSSGTKVLLEAAYSDELGLQRRGALLTLRPKSSRW